MTALDLITGSLRLLGVTASGESLSANESSDALSALNDLLDSWSTQSLLVPNRVREVFPLVSGQQSYTIGTGGNFNTARPMRIENALIQMTSTSPTAEIPLKILTKDQFAGIILKGLTSTYPRYVYPEGTFPLETLNVWPIPSQADNIVLYSWKPLANLTSLSTVLNLPPGYNRALKHHLAVELAPEFGRSVAPEIVAVADAAIADIKRMNFKPSYMRVDDALKATPAVWNWMTGEPQ